MKLTQKPIQRPDMMKAIQQKLQAQGYNPLAAQKHYEPTTAE